MGESRKTGFARRFWKELITWALPSRPFWGGVDRVWVNSSSRSLILSSSEGRRIRYPMVTATRETIRIWVSRLGCFIEISACRKFRGEGSLGYER